MITQFIENLTNDEKHAIIASYEQFKLDGYIGDEPIRTSKVFNR